MIGGGSSSILIPASSYIVAWSMRSQFSTSPSNVKLKVSASQQTGYTQYGGVLPSDFVPDNTRVYYVLKRPSALTPSSPGYVTEYAGGSFNFLGALSPGTPDYELLGTGDVSNLDGSFHFPVKLMAQVISTTQKQW